MTNSSYDGIIFENFLMVVKGKQIVLDDREVLIINQQ